MVGWLGGCLHWLAGRFGGYLNVWDGWPALVGKLIVWLVIWVVGWLGGLSGWLPGWLVRVCRLVGRGSSVASMLG